MSEPRGVRAPESDPPEVLMTDWFRRARKAQKIHYACANLFNSLHFWLGIPTMALTAAVGTAVFVSFQEEVAGNWKVGLGLISILATILSALQTFLNSAKRAEDHRLTAARYGGVRRRLAILRTFLPEEVDELRKELWEVKGDMNALAESAPDVPGWIKRKISKQLKSVEHAPEAP